MKLKIIGAFTVGTFLYGPFSIAYKSRLELPNFEKYGAGSYAIVTGATEGIGRGFCESLASHGVNIILISRNQSKLDEVAQELSSKYKVKTITHALDLSIATEADYKGLKAKTDNVDVSILINNAGVVSYKKTSDLTYSDINSTIALNSSSVMHLLSIYLPVFEARNSRSAVINLSSFLAVKPTPILSIYSATKAFNHFASVGLATEYKHKIDVLSFQPSTVITKAVPNETTSWRSATVEQAVKGALVDLGRRNVSYGHWNHELMAWAFGWIPEPLSSKMSCWYIKQIIRRRLGKDITS